MSSNNCLNSPTRNSAKGLLRPGMCHTNHLWTPTCRDVYVSLINSIEYCTVFFRRMLTLDSLADKCSVFYLVPSKIINSNFIGNALPMLTLKRHTRMILWASARPMIIFKLKKKT